MISLCTMRRFGPWLLGLFLVAQIAGIVPLVVVHIQHIFETSQDIAADIANTGLDHRRHHHGLDDSNDQCCTLHHHLAGIVSDADGVGIGDYFTAPIVRLSLRSLVGAEPGLLERPPKSLLSI
jgi:hypothetical protein